VEPKLLDHEELQVGERDVKVSRASQNRRGRSLTKVRIFDDKCLGLAEAAILWGATIECIVHFKECNHEVNALFNQPKSINIASARTEFPQSDSWNGILLGTVSSPGEADLARELVLRWNPQVCIITCGRKFSRRVTSRLLTGTNYRDTHRRLDFFCRHVDFGGVTAHESTVVHFSLLELDLERETIMTGLIELRRSLQTGLDDTRGNEGSFIYDNVPEQPLPGEFLPPHAIGFVIERNTFGGVNEIRRPVYDGSDLGPDLSRAGCSDRQFWVLANSTFGRGGRVLRRVEYYEMLSCWDYEGKLESQHWSLAQRRTIAELRLANPPGKIIRHFVFHACSLFDLTDDGPADETTNGEAGLTADVKYSPLELNVETRAVAARADDAEVDLSQWALPDESAEVAHARVVLRRFAVRWWAHYQTRQARKWLEDNADTVGRADAEGVEDCLRRCHATTYWSWNRGSRLMFWKFPPEWLADARDGIPFWHSCPPPKGFRRNPPAISRSAEIEMRKKIFRLRFRWYLEPGAVSLLTPRFAVVKAMVDGEVVDIRLIMDCKKSGLNATLVTPGFMLPTIQDAEDMVIKWLDRPLAAYLSDGSPILDYSLQLVYIVSVQVDIDVGEMFHNYRAHLSARKYLGVRCIETKNDGSVENETYMRSSVLVFGCSSSPYQAGQGQSRILDICKGDRHDDSNPWQWDRVHLNLPFSRNYDPSLPRILLIRKDGELATREATYVDDIRIGARGMVRGRSASKYLKSRMNSLGNQADDRKSYPPSTSPGPWKGNLIGTATPFPMKSTTGKKWSRFRAGLTYILERAKTPGVIETAELRKIAGLGVHLTEIYQYSRPYLKGFFNALEAFRDGRDLEGWALGSTMESAKLLELEDAGTAKAREGYPILTRISDELVDHTKALLVLFVNEEPLVVPIRPTDRNKLRYYGGDASAEGFYSTTQYPDGHVESREGLWDERFAEGGSNLREAQNQVNHLLGEVKAGKHDGCELWCVTDNAVWSSVWQKGMSSAKHLFKLVLELKQECLQHEVYLHLFHISGNRMIATGIDGLSRGNQDGGIAVGYDLRKFVPVDRGAFDLGGPRLEKWCRSWMGDDFTPPLTPEGWFSKGHQPGVHLWAPPPGAALGALKQLAQSRQKRPETVTHVFICQRILWSEEWRTRFEKEVDVWFFLHPGSVWTHDMFEPLLVGISFPTRRTKPWMVRHQRNEVVEAGHALSKMSKNCHVQVGDYLRKLWTCQRPLPPLPSSLLC